MFCCHLLPSPRSFHLSVSVCLSVSGITKKLLNGFQWKLEGGWKEVEDGHWAKEWGWNHVFNLVNYYHCKTNVFTGIKFTTSTKELMLVTTFYNITQDTTDRPSRQRIKHKTVRQTETSELIKLNQLYEEKVLCSVSCWLRRLSFT